MGRPKKGFSETGFITFNLELPHAQKFFHRWQEYYDKDLWMDLDELVELHNIDWIWVKGHSGDFGNEIADKLATSAISN